MPNLVREALDLERATDSEFIVRTLVDAKPSTKAGRALAYHAVSGGFILGEVVRRATGRDIREVLAEEILRPLGFRWTNYGFAEADLGTVAINYVTGPPTAPPFSQLLTRALGLGLDDLVSASNDRRFLTAIISSANIVTTAVELSRFYELLRRGGELDGVRVMRPETIRRALKQQSHLEVDLSLGFPTRFGYGYMLGSRLLSLYGRDTQHAFGHLGFTNILAWPIRSGSWRARSSRAASRSSIPSCRGSMPWCSGSRTRRRRWPEIRRRCGIRLRVVPRPAGSLAVGQLWRQ